MATRKVVVLRCSDGVHVEVEAAMAMMSTTIRRRIEAGRDSVIELTDISSEVLDKVIEYCSKHAAAASSASGPPAPSSSSALEDWESEFINSMDDDTISHVISALNYLEVKGLPELSMDKKLVTLCCSDHEKSVVERHIALKLEIVRSMLEMQPECSNSPIILPNATSAMLSPVLEFYRKHSWAETAAVSETKINEINQEFVKIYASRCFDLIRAASFLEAKSLLDVLVDTVKAVPEFADLASSNILTKVVENHYTEEEEKAMAAQLSNALA